MSRDWLNLTWREKTAGERAQTAVSFAIATVITVGMFAGGLVALNGMRGLSSHKAQHDRCLTKAANGYEIKQC